MIYTKALPGKFPISIHIRPFTKEDITKKYVNWMNDPLVTKYNSHGLFPYTKKQQNEFLQDLENPSSKIVWAIVMQTFHTIPDNYGIDREVPYSKHIGNCSLQRIDYINRSAEFAIVIGDTDYWGKGICTLVLDMVLEHAFKNLGLFRVWTGTAVTNKGMQRAAEKCGFKGEGIFRGGIFLQGKFENVCTYGILAWEYLENKTE